MSRWRTGWGWLVLMAVPPVVVVAGLVALFWPEPDLVEPGKEAP